MIWEIKLASFTYGSYDVSKPPSLAEIRSMAISPYAERNSALHNHLADLAQEGRVEFVTRPYTTGLPFELVAFFGDGEATEIRLLFDWVTIEEKKTGRARKLRKID